MAWPARPGLKLGVDLVWVILLHGQNGLWGPFAFETHPREARSTDPYRLKGRQQTGKTPGSVPGTGPRSFPQAGLRKVPRRFPGSFPHCLREGSQEISWEFSRGLREGFREFSREKSRETRAAVSWRARPPQTPESARA